MYREHVLKSIVILLVITFNIVTPYLFLYWFYGSHFTAVFGDYFSHIFVFLEQGYTGYIFISPQVHTSAMLGFYFYIVSCCLLFFLSFLWIKKIFFGLDRDEVNGGFYSQSKCHDIDLDILDNTKKIKIK
ncbi:MAG: hypothetical protein EVJ48_02895 [Candidatus Acidulodesulfobacterium acidiphilum]|uniref:Uncharacterized protein n=1 Tax=Candidatus Acidulodesulfobacterium acidiphilum TaxID=2597224 RepID=A0A520XFF6_9DELT|nr:MAG: hypothetical protein EVJ48_02895 [Candidatus Acidulodesulfobacterium acidiphilum]